MLAISLNAWYLGAKLSSLVACGVAVDLGAYPACLCFELASENSHCGLSALAVA